jgi:hypothetical protein
MRKLSINDHNIYEVRLVVAIPDYGISKSVSHYTALDAIVPTLDGELIVLDMAETELFIGADDNKTTAVATYPVITTVTNNTSTTIGTSTKVAAKKQRAKRTVIKKANAHARWTDADILAVVEAVQNSTLSAARTYKKVGKQLGRTDKACQLAYWKYTTGRK